MPMGIAGLRAPSRAGLLRGAAIPAFQVAPHVDDFTADGDALTFRLREHDQWERPKHHDRGQHSECGLHLHATLRHES